MRQFEIIEKYLYVSVHIYLNNKFERNDYNLFTSFTYQSTN